MRIPQTLEVRELLRLEYRSRQAYAIHRRLLMEISLWLHAVLFPALSNMRLHARRVDERSAFLIYSLFLIGLPFSKRSRRRQFIECFHILSCLISVERACSHHSVEIASKCPSLHVNVLAFFSPLVDTQRSVLMMIGFFEGLLLTESRRLFFQREHDRSCFKCTGALIKNPAMSICEFFSYLIRCLLSVDAPRFLLDPICRSSNYNCVAPVRRCGCDDGRTQTLHRCFSPSRVEVLSDNLFQRTIFFPSNLWASGFHRKKPTVHNRRLSASDSSLKQSETQFSHACSRRLHSHDIAFSR